MIYLKIFVKGYWNSNLGDDLFLKTLCERYPNNRFSVVVSKKSADTIRSIPNLDIVTRNIFDRLFTFFCSRLFLYSKFANMDKELRLARKCNIICEIGGSIFKMPSSGMGYIYMQRKKILDLGKPYLVIGSNFGPHFHNYQVDKYKKFFGKCEGVVFREKKSYNIFKENENVDFAPDVIFSMNTKKRINYSDYILISVIDPFTRFSNKVAQNYYTYLVLLINYYLKRNRSVLLMSFCENEFDYNFAKKIAHNLHNINVKVYNHRDVNESLEVIKKAEKIIATRYHAMILGWVYKIPTFAICYDMKMNNVIEDFLPDQSKINIEELNSNTSIPPNFSTIKQEELDKLKNNSQGQFKYLDKLLERE